MIADHGGALIRLVALAVALALIVSVLWITLGAVKSRLERRMPRFTPRQRHYDWEPRTRQIARQLKVGAGPREDRDRILSFLDSRTGVEAFVEPRTVMHPLSVVLVARDGEWVRIELNDDRFLRELARTHGLRVQDATRVGYPERMRRYRRSHGDPGSDASGS
jgi:hypothetical protein